MASLQPLEVTIFKDTQGQCEWVRSALGRFVGESLMVSHSLLELVLLKSPRTKSW